MLMSFIKKITDLPKFKIYMGLDPRFVKGPAIILFPLHNNLLCCGLAGILTIKGAPCRDIAHPLSTIEKLFEKIKEHNMGKILAGSLRPESYLDGGGFLEKIEQTVRLLKTDENFCQLFFDKEKTGKFISTVKAIRDFLSQEEHVVEEKAGLFSTAKMEIINRRLLMLRDTVWAAEQDIISNVEKILKLSGAKGISEIPPKSLKKYKRKNVLNSVFLYTFVASTMILGTMYLLKK